jgi:hypothetical protein
MLDVGGKLELMRMFATLPRMKPQTLARRSIQQWLERTFRNRQARQFMAMEETGASQLIPVISEYSTPMVRSPGC